MDYFKWDGFPSKEKIETALSEALKIIDRTMQRLGDGFAEDESAAGKYIPAGNVRWTAGFLTGILWISYELTGDEKYRKLAEKHVESFIERIDKKLYVEHHDMGFLYSLSCVSAYQLTGNTRARKAALDAADHLAARYMPKGEFINAWGIMNDENHLRNGWNFLIIDCLFNIPLLYWASEETKDPHYKEIAKKHLATTVKYILREDGSSYHKYVFDYDTGKPLYGGTAQGASDDSCWARGQAWGIGGFALNYKDTGNEDDVKCFKSVLNYYLAHLPKDKVPFWDLIFTDGDDEPRDSSSAVIVICAIMEMSKHLPADDPDIIRYKKAAGEMFNSIINNYAASFDMDCDGLLLHGTGSKPHNEGVDECTVYGDYFYMEAIIRSLRDWKMYW